VSVPLAWEELEALTNSDHWTASNIEGRLEIGNAVRSKIFSMPMPNWTGLTVDNVLGNYNQGGKKLVKTG